MSSTPRFIQAAVAAPHWLAAEAGRDILATGGSALEATVAMAAVLAVVYPHRNGLGGDAAWLVWERTGKIHVIDAGGPAGGGAAGERYRREGYDEIPLRGTLAAATVPGAVAGWELALEMARAFGGRLPLTEILAPAIRHARDGAAQSRRTAALDLQDLASLQDVPGFADTFLVEGKMPASDVPRQAPRLAALLERIAHAGLRDFYRGDVGREIAADMDRLGADRFFSDRLGKPILRRDIETFTARLRKPLSLRIAAFTVFAPPPPTLGLAGLITTGIFARLGAAKRDEFAQVHGLVEAAKRAIPVAAQVCIDPHLLDEDPASWLTADTLERERMTIRRDRAAPCPAFGTGSDSIWFGAIDPTGLAVSCSQTLHSLYGSGCVLPRTGILLNNRIASFSLDSRAPQALAPGRRPPAAAAPLLAQHDDGRILAFGSGDPQVDAQIFAHVAEGTDLADAVDAPRYRLEHRKGAKNTMLRMEDRFDPSLIRALENAGHEIALTATDAGQCFAQAGAILRHRDGSLEAAHDPRADGGADGL